MKTFKMIIGLMWAFLCLILILFLFPALRPLAYKTSQLPFMKINEWHSGGEVVKEIKMENYTLNIRKPVFNALIGERKKGFVQIDWIGVLPEMLNDTIDYDNDNKNDFVIQINTVTEQSTINPLNLKIGKIKVSTPTTYGWAARIILHK